MCVRVCVMCMCVRVQLRGVNQAGHAQGECVYMCVRLCGYVICVCTCLCDVYACACAIKRCQSSWACPR